MQPSELTKPEVEHYLATCNFTKDERELFLYRTQGYTHEETTDLMNVSLSTVKRIYQRVKSKMARC